ncbi:hypothetical protein FACS1894187_22650 [Synergistales bacterium]|nr:hypothetical protein FACS1894187_22650 [Synergistales bacterium]
MRNERIESIIQRRKPLAGSVNKVLDQTSQILGALDQFRRSCRESQEKKDIDIAAHGGLLFGLIFKFVFGEHLSGMFLGAIFSAGFLTYVTESETCRPILSGVLKIFSILRFLRPILGGILKILPFLAVLFPLFVVSKRQERFNDVQYQECLYGAYSNWLLSVELVGSSIMESIPCEENIDNPVVSAEKEKIPDDSRNIAHLVNILLAPADTDQEKVVLLKVMKSAAGGMGYSRVRPDDAVGAEQKLLWREELRERYKTFGLVEAGDEIEVVEDALLKDGVVTEKGLVRRRKGTV